MRELANHMVASSVSDRMARPMPWASQRVAEQLRDIALPVRSGRREGNAGYHQVLDEPWKIRPDPSTRSDKAAARRRPVGFQDFLNRRALTIEQSATAGLAFSSGLPARTVPVEIWDRLNLGRSEAAIISLQRFQPPYWTGPEVPCISPMQVDLIGTSGDIRALVRAP
jgi:hypothetical protein